MAKDERAKLRARGLHLLGASFVFNMTEILGTEYENAQMPLYEGQVLMIVGFKPRLINNVVVQEPNGRYSLMPLWMVERALSLQTQQTREERGRL
jgi:hypothetical protein